MMPSTQAVYGVYTKCHYFGAKLCTVCRTSAHVGCTMLDLQRWASSRLSTQVNRVSFCAIKFVCFPQAMTRQKMWVWVWEVGRGRMWACVVLSLSGLYQLKLWSIWDRHGSKTEQVFKYVLVRKTKFLDFNFFQTNQTAEKLRTRAPTCSRIWSEKIKTSLNPVYMIKPLRVFVSVHLHTQFHWPRWAAAKWLLEQYHRRYTKTL